MSLDALEQLAYSYYPVVYAVLLLLLLAPWTGTTTRAAFAVVLLLSGLALLVYGLTQASETRTLGIVNPFFRENMDQPYSYLTETVTAPGWHWPLAAAVAIWAPAVVIWMRRQRPPSAPHPVSQASALGIWVVVTRLALEKTAAPDGLVWAIGLSPALLLILPFFGGAAGSRGMNFKEFAIALLLHTLIVRGVITVIGYCVTVGGLGTHLDVSTLTDFKPPGLPNFDLTSSSATGRWFWGIAFAQMVFWVLFSMLAGIVLGCVPFLLSRHRGRTS